MDVTHLLSRDPASLGANQPTEAPRQNHSYPTRHANAAFVHQPHEFYAVQSSNMPQGVFGSNSAQASPTRWSSQAPKTVNFQLLLSNGLDQRARLPLRVHINLHDTTESIVTTVKNFYGLYDGQGVSFEDNTGATLIAQYENLTHNATVYVRVFAEQPEVVDMHNRSLRGSASPRRPRLDEPFQMPPPPPYSRPSSRTLKRRSASPPGGRGRQSPSARSQHRLKLRGSQELPDDEAANGVSDSDAGSVSVSSSRRDQLASAEISLDNILEGGRRKKAKFESSELPLFVPSQQPMAASLSSISPQRRMTNSFAPSPMPPNNQYTFSYNPPLPSPQSFTNHEFSTPNGMPAAQRSLTSQNHGHRLRARDMGSQKQARPSGASATGVFPTPDPTIGSAISDEDVALQLMRLGDASNISSYGRTSTSTADDAFSGKAEAASSAEPSEDESEEEEFATQGHTSHGHGPVRKKMKRGDGLAHGYESGDSSVDEYDDESFAHGLKVAKSRSGSGHPKGQARQRLHSHGIKSKSKTMHGGSKIPPSPYSYQPGSASRKTSSASTSAFPNPDEDDLSSKPRCQRCRKSKKGCDRQRPCQRCKDAGIGVEGCVSEDEGNGRKGRFGRHMGVPVKKPFEDGGMSMPALPSTIPLDAFSVGDGGKKRKR